MKSRIVQYAGYFVAMLLLAAHLTGVLQHGILPRLRHQEATPQHNEQSAISDQQPTPQESDQAPATDPTPGGQTPSLSPEDKSATLPVLQKSEQASASTGLPSPLPPGGSDKPVLNRVEGSAAADRQEKLLAEKRAELSRLEEQIRKRKEESAVEEKWLAELKASGAKLAKERNARREAGIKKLAKLYEGMEPEAAASILSKLEKNMAVEVLASMKDRQASRVLTVMNGQKARELSERLQEAKLDQTAGQGKAREETP